MDLSINSYNNDEHLYSTVRGKLKQKKFHIRVADLNHMQTFAATKYPKDIFSVRFLRNLRNALEIYVKNTTSKSNDARVFENVMGFDRDLYFTIDMMGRAPYSNKYSILFSLQDSLDLILNHLCGVPIECVRNIPNYKVISRGFLSLDFDLMRNMTMQVFLDVHPKLDSFLVKLYSTSCGVEGFEEKFLKLLLQTADTLLHDFASKYRSICKDNGINLVLRSYDLSSVILGVDGDKVDDRFFVKDDYCLLVRSYGKDEFFSFVEDDCSEVI